ncbi:MAG: helix-turn-helix domain-containing protein [Thermoanaerobaculia bacterium]|nr:helix-turn-helix domain-containing protein [Thermoanaerobaculia bacterium]
MLGISPRTLEGLRVSGRGPAFTRVGGRVLYRRGALDEHLRAQERTSTSNVA